MKIRTITSGLFLESPKQFERIVGTAGFNRKAKSFFENYENINASARAIKEIAGGNFRFCASANCCSGIPFFPVSFHEGRESSFSVGFFG